MSFKDDVESTHLLSGKWNPGLQALPTKDRALIEPKKQALVAPGSVFVDEAYQQADPNGHRWDYAIACKHDGQQEEMIYWVEAHTASDKELKKVLDKLKWLRAWLKEHGKKLATYDREYIWVASGSTSFTAFSRQKKTMADAGLRFVGGRFCIPCKRA